MALKRVGGVPRQATAIALSFALCAQGENSLKAVPVARP
jgi:hypothetical protein